MIQKQYLDLLGYREKILSLFKRPEQENIVLNKSLSDKKSIINKVDNKGNSKYKITQNNNRIDKKKESVFNDRKLKIKEKKELIFEYKKKEVEQK